MDNWIKIFKVGTHKDSRGRERTWTAADLDRMVQAYNPADHEAPVVIGSPKDTDPAYGWVESLKRVGDHLMAKFKQVVPEFASMFEQGAFTKRSIWITPNGTLGHVGFHGAAAPTLKGLSAFEFEEGEEYIEFGESAEDPELESDMKLAEEIAAYVNR